MTYHFRPAATGQLASGPLTPSLEAAPAPGAASAAPPLPRADTAPPAPPSPAAAPLALDDPGLRETEMFDRARQSAFLTALAECGSARGAARVSGISHQTVYRQRRACAVFRKGWDAALIAARAVAEEALACRAIDGLEEEVWFRGEVVGVRRRYDTRLLLAHLARLDKLAEDAEARAFAEDFEGSLERFAEGSDTPQVDPDAPPPAPAAAPASGESPEQCNTRSTPAIVDADMRTLADRIARSSTFAERVAVMEASRPVHAPRLNEFPGHSPVLVADEQLGAFENGIDEWWIVVPPGKDWPEDEYCFWEGDLEDGAPEDEPDGAP